MLAKNRSLNEIYYKLLLNSPQMITMDIPLKIGKGNISQTKIKHGVILADWKMCYESDMNVQGPVSNEYIQIIENFLLIMSSCQCTFYKTYDIYISNLKAIHISVLMVRDLTPIRLYE